MPVWPAKVHIRGYAAVNLDTNSSPAPRAGIHSVGLDRSRDCPCLPMRIHWLALNSLDGTDFELIKNKDPGVSWVCSIYCWGRIGMHTLICHILNGKLTCASVQAGSAVRL